MNETKKRKLDSDATTEPSKKLKMTTMEGTSSSATSGATVEHAQQPPEPAVEAQKSPPQEEQNPRADQPQTKQKGKGKEKERPVDVQPSSRRRINKLKPPRPFPTVPTSVSATGPRSAHREGKDMICITRKTSLGAYMRRCKRVIIEDGYVPRLNLGHLRWKITLARNLAIKLCI